MKIKKEKGFSLIEVIFGFFILVIGLLTLLTAISKSVLNSKESQESIIASQLVQEGLELMHFIRDANVRTGESSYEYLGTGTVCVIDSNFDYGTDSIACGANDLLRRNTLTGEYTHSGGESTKFHRRFFINAPEIEGEPFRQITMYVYWGVDAPNVPADCTLVKKCVYAETLIGNWSD